MPFAHPGILLVDSGDDVTIIIHSCLLFILANMTSPDRSGGTSLSLTTVHVSILPQLPAGVLNFFFLQTYRFILQTVYCGVKIAKEKSRSRTASAT